MERFWTQSSKNIFVAAHRGWSSRYPENSMLAFRAAAEIGVDQIEMDIRVTRDGELVVFHDETVDRVSNGSGKVCDFTLKELQSFDIGIKKGEEFSGTRIPTLVEFLDYIKSLPDMTIDFEFKEYDREGELSEKYIALCERVLSLIEEYGLSERCVINSFGSNLHEYIQKKYPGRYKHHVFFPAHRNLNATCDPYSYAYCCCVFDQDKKNFEMLRERGVRTWVGASVKDAETVEWAIEMGAELITCNNPDEILRLLRERGYHK
jgi:glycerophosphoryl diester phosphodiesterase